MLTPDLQEFIRAMPKAEVHIHLEGSIAPETVLELARRNRRLENLPASDVDGLRRWYTFTDFSHFVTVYVAIMGMLQKPEDFALVVYEHGADMARQNIRYREVTFTPYLHLGWEQKGLSIPELLDGINEGRERARKEFGVEMRWVFDVPRNANFPDPASAANYNPEPSDLTLEVALAGRARGVVGFGLGGYEVNCPPEPFAHVFAPAKAAGLLSVPHAGETEGPASVWGALNDLEADRIGHGVRAIEDPALLDELKRRGIPLEVNPTSNIALRVYPDYAAHPFRRLDEMGLTVTVNSDDPPLFNTTLTHEYEVLAEHFGYDRAGLARIARNAYVIAGVEEDVKGRLLAEFDAWAAANA